MATLAKEQTRFDTRLSTEQKQFFEKAAALAGYRTLTDFILKAVQEKAKAIIQEHEKILVSQKDCELFFDEITHPKKPNKSLRKAYDEYKKQVLE